MEQAQVIKEKVRKPRPTAFIDQDGCTGCEICMSVCPKDCIIKVYEVVVPEFAGICRVIEEHCTGCTICAKDCPWEAITMVKPILV
jgi:Pyruvate/2-oxoacid:ferredoxin oxidoreductase delta subunit